MSFVYERAVRFEEVDAAGIVFFARFFHWCHEAMERFFDGVEGGYVGLINDQRIGFPTVHLTSDWRKPLRYGDVVRIELTVLAIGNTSVTLRYVLTSPAWEHVATIEQVAVATNLDTMSKIPIPSACRALLEVHRVVPGGG